METKSEYLAHLLLPRPENGPFPPISGHIES